MSQTVKNMPSRQESWFRSWVGKIRQRRKWQPTPVFLPGELHRQRSLAGYSPWGQKQLDMAEQLTHTHNRIFSLFDPKSISIWNNKVEPEDPEDQSKGPFRYLAWFHRNKPCPDQTRCFTPPPDRLTLSLSRDTAGLRDRLPHEPGKPIWSKGPGGQVAWF